MEAVGARGRGDVQLSATSGALFGACRQRIDAELRNRVQRDSEPYPGALRLIHDIGRINAVIGKIAVVETPPGEANRPLVVRRLCRLRRARMQSVPPNCGRSVAVRLPAFFQSGWSPRWGLRSIEHRCGRNFRSSSPPAT